MSVVLSETTIRATLATVRGRWIAKIGLHTTNADNDLLMPRGRIRDVGRTLKQESHALGHRWRIMGDAIAHMPER
jgi:hypothetical protein